MEGHTDSARIDSSVIAGEDNGKSEDDDEPPAAADRLFDDFIYAFMHTRSFQLSRIKFPLMNLTDGKDSPVKKEDWKYDKLYSGEDTYMMLFDDVRSTVCEKDTSLHHADVEFIDLGRKRVKQYSFDKEKGKWLLTKIDNHALAANVNNDFFSFYRRFVSDEAYQLAHILNPFKFVTYDSDDYQQLEGVLDVEQWPDFRPEMPSGVVTNINYGQRYDKQATRVLVIASPSAGMSCTLYFSKRNGVWKLTELDNV